MKELSRQERAEKIEGTIRDIKLKFRDIDKQLIDSRIPYTTIDTDKLIRSECQKHQIKESVIRKIAEWQSLHTGSGTCFPMQLLKSDTDDD